MSAEIRSMGGRLIRVTGEEVDGDAAVRIEIDRVGVNVASADFLAAVASELDVIVIPRADLPEVRDTGDGFAVAGHPAVIASKRSNAAGADRFRQIALAHLALAEWLDAEPPVDEEEVAVLVHAIGSEVGTIKMGELDRIARRLVAAGWKR